LTLSDDGTMMIQLVSQTDLSKSKQLLKSLNSNSIWVASHDRNEDSTPRWSTSPANRRSVMMRDAISVINLPVKVRTTVKLSEGQFNMSTVS
jgi:hypothetical protein